MTLDLALYADPENGVLPPSEFKLYPGRLSLVAIDPQFDAGTSVEQIKHFYFRNLPMAPELVKNLRSFVEYGPAINPF